MRRIRRDSETLLQDLFYRGVHAGDRDTPVSVQPARSSPVYDILLWADWKNKTAACLPPQIPAQPGKDARLIHSIASLIRAKSKLLVLENPDTVEIYKVGVRAITMMYAKIQKITFLDSIHFKKSLHGSHGKTWHKAFFSFFNANDPPPPPSVYVSTTQLSDSAARSSRTGRDDVYLPAITRRASSLNSIKGALSQSCPYLHDKRRGSFSSVASQRTGGHGKKQVICQMSYPSWKEKKKSIDSSYPRKPR